MRNLAGISLGGKDKYTTVTNICANAFQGYTSLKRLTLHGARELTVGMAHPRIVLVGKLRPCHFNGCFVPQVV